MAEGQSWELHLESSGSVFLLRPMGESKNWLTRMSMVEDGERRAAGGILESLNKVTTRRARAVEASGSGE